MGLPKVGQNRRFEHLDPEISGLLNIIENLNISPEFSGFKFPTFGKPKTVGGKLIDTLLIIDN